MKDYCENQYCENPGCKEIPASADRPGDQRRTLCVACEEAYTWGVQHGGMALDLQLIDEFFRTEGFAVVSMNRDDPNPDAPFEAWAYHGPLDFGTAVPVVFSLGANGLAALRGLNEKLARHETTNEPTQPMSRRTPLLVDDRELATILAALRFHQDENRQRGGQIPDQAIADIATDAGAFEPLNFEEISALCERLNLAEPSVGARRGVSHPGLRQIHDLLYLDCDAQREFYNPDKEWDADTLAMIAEVVAEYIPRPGQAPEAQTDDHGGARDDGDTIPTVAITIHGGVADVLVKPAGAAVTIIDYDVEAEDPRRLSADRSGDPCSIAEWPADVAVGSKDLLPQTRPE